MVKANAKSFCSIKLAFYVKNLRRQCLWNNGFGSLYSPETCELGNRFCRVSIYGLSALPEKHVRYHAQPSY